MLPLPVFSGSGRTRQERLRRRLRRSSTLDRTCPKVPEFAAIGSMGTSGQDGSHLNVNVRGKPVTARGGCSYRASPGCRLRLTAPTMILIARPRMTRSPIICPVTTSRAAWVLAVMSPNPTVENTVTVKYSPSVCVSRAPKLLPTSRP